MCYFADASIGFAPLSNERKNLIFVFVCSKIISRRFLFQQQWLQSSNLFVDRNEMTMPSWHPGNWQHELPALIIVVHVTNTTRIAHTKQQNSWAFSPVFLFSFALITSFNENSEYTSPLYIFQLKCLIIIYYYFIVTSTRLISSMISVFALYTFPLFTLSLFLYLFPYRFFPQTNSSIDKF